MAGTRRYMTPAALKRARFKKFSGRSAPLKLDVVDTHKYKVLIAEVQRLEAVNPDLKTLRAASPALKYIDGSRHLYPTAKDPFAVLQQSKLPAASPDPVSSATEALAAGLREARVDLSGLDTTRLVQSWLRAVPHKETNELAARVGPFYDTAALTSWLGISRQALNKRVKAGKLVACMTSDRMMLYPTWQFNDDGELLPHLPEVLKVLRSGTSDGWTIALWLITPVEELDGQSAVDWLAAGKDPEPILESARHDAAAWAA